MSRVTSIDVARRAGVSQTTVSLVFSGKAAGRVGAGTIEAVRRAAEELGYRPNVAAQALRTGRSRAIGLVVPDITNPFFGRLLRGAQLAAREQGFVVALVDLARDDERRADTVNALRTTAVDGYLTFALDPVGEFPGWSEPAVAIEAWEAGVPLVRLDVEDGIAQVLEHLRALGHERLGVLDAAADAPTFSARIEELRRRLGHDPPRARARHELDDAARAAAELLDRPERPTAILAADDTLAAGIYLAARERGVRIPDDVSVVGFDDLEVARVVDPPMTTVEIDPERLGAVAVELLLAGPDAPSETILPVRLLVRGSTGPAPA